MKLRTAPRNLVVFMIYLDLNWSLTLHLPQSTIALGKVASRCLGYAKNYKAFRAVAGAANDALSLGSITHTCSAWTTLNFWWSTSLNDFYLDVMAFNLR